MLFELTEVLTCPRCGPRHGLILLVQASEGRRVRRGWLGCANCGTDFPVRRGVADLRLEPETWQPAEPFLGDDLAVKIAALSGLTEGPGYLLLDEPLRDLAGDVADLIPGVEVLALGLGDDEEERPGVSRILCDRGIPVADYRLRAAAGTPGEDRLRLQTLARTVMPRGRLVALDLGGRGVEALERFGLELLGHEGRTVVAERKRYDSSSPD